MIKNLIAKYLGKKEMLLKKVDSEEMTITAVVLEPNPLEDGTTNDLHNDYYTAEEVAKACASFNEHCKQPNLEHEVKVGNLTERRQKLLDALREFHNKWLKDE